MASEDQRNKFITSLPSFLSVTTPQVSGVIWVSPHSLSEREKPFTWFNYLFDGVLETQIHHFATQERSIYKTNQFGKSFYLLHMQESFTQIDKAYQDFISILKQDISSLEHQDNIQKSQILLLAQRPQFFSGSIKKKNTSFEHLEYYY